MNEPTVARLQRYAFVLVRTSLNVGWENILALFYPSKNRSL